MMMKLNALKVKSDLLLRSLSIRQIRLFPANMKTHT